MHVPPEAALDWPLDVFERRADKARLYESLQFPVLARSQGTTAVAMAGLHEKSKRRALAVGLPPYFLDE